MFNITPADHSKPLWWVPNAFSFSRGGLAAWDIQLLWQAIATGRGWALVFWVTLLLLLTDWIDGKIARKWNLTSDFGAILDTLMDKLAVAALLFVIAWWSLISDNPWINWIIFWAILAREILVAIGRPLLKKFQGLVMNVQQHGKFKMWVQGAALVAVPASHYILPDILPWNEIVPGLFWAAAFTTLQSLYTYAKDVSALLGAATPPEPIAT